MVFEDVVEPGDARLEWQSLEPEEDDARMRLETLEDQLAEIPVVRS
jgi:hypothetical protein